MKPVEIGPDGKLRVGDLLHDWTLPVGWVREVVRISRPEDVVVTGEGLYRGSAAESCALHGGKAQWRDPK